MSSHRPGVVPDGHAHPLAGDRALGVFTAWCGDALLTVAAHDSDRLVGSLACPLCADVADGGGPSAGWPLVELFPSSSVASRSLRLVRRPR